MKINFLDIVNRYVACKQVALYTTQLYVHKCKNT